MLRWSGLHFPARLKPEAADEEVGRQLQSVKICELAGADQSCPCRCMYVIVAFAAQPRPVWTIHGSEARVMPVTDEAVISWPEPRRTTLHSSVMDYW